MDRFTRGSMLRRGLGALPLALAGLMSVSALTGSALAVHEDLQCEDVGPGNGPDPVRCTETNAADCECSALLSCPASPPEFKKFNNVLWVMADDHNYCMYRFMHQAGPSDALGQLRVDDLTCRYRNSTGNSDNSFVFGLDRVDPVDLGPCPPEGGTCPAAYCAWDASFAGVPRKCTADADCPGSVCVKKPCDDNADCRILATPTLDELARQGAVFPVAHVPGNSCAPSLKGAALGRYAKDVQDVVTDGVLPCERPVGESPCTCPEPLLTSTTDDSCGVSPSCLCENTRTLPRLLHQSAAVPAHATYLRGKFRESREGLLGYPNCASFKEPEEDNDNTFGLLSVGECGPACQANVENEYLSLAHATNGGLQQAPEDSYQEIQPFLDWIDALPLTASYEMEHPFLLGWTPENPHDGNNTRPPPVVTAAYCADEGCSRAYGGRHGSAAEGLARVTNADYMLGILREQLMRRCVCHGGEATSLWDMTVVVFHSDHGAFMPWSKNKEPDDAPLGRGESGSRTTLLISHPDHRRGLIKPEVYSGHVVQTVDAFRTMLEHFDDVDDQVSGDDVPTNLKGKDLWGLISQSPRCGPGFDPCTGGATCVADYCRRACTVDTDCPPTDICAFDGQQRSCRRRIRDAMITQGGRGNDYAPWNAWVVRPRKGIVGVCAANAAPNTIPPDVTGQLTFCVRDGLCPNNTFCECPSGTFCQKASEGDVGAGVCINRATGGRTRCHVDADCAPAGVCDFPVPSCPAKVCMPGTPGSFFDFGGRTCTTDGGCVPAGTCSPPKVVYSAKAKGTPKRVDTGVNAVNVFEVHSDPDTMNSLGAASLGGCLKCLLKRCAERWEDWPSETGAEPENVARCLERTYADPGYPGVPDSNCANVCG